MMVRSSFFLFVSLVFWGWACASPALGTDDARRRLLAPRQETNDAYAPPDISIITQSCMTCHGYEGRFDNGEIPPLTGWQREALFERLVHLRDGTDEATIMKRLLVPFSDRDLRDIALYFSNIK